MGFDAAVAAAGGAPMDDVVMGALFSKYPQAKVGYEAGMQAWKARQGK